MSNVKTKDVPFCERYVNLVLDGDILRGPMIANLKCLYEFIGKNSPGNPKYELGNGCRAILQKARALAGCRAHIISKRQVIALIDAQCAGKTNDIVEYIKTYFPEKYDAGIIYHVHNGYLMVYVSTGIIGIVLLNMQKYYALLLIMFSYRHNNI